MAKKKSKKKKTQHHKTAGPSPPAPSAPARDLKKILPAIRNPWLWLIIIMLAGLWFRLSNTMFTPLIYPDSVQYMALADDIKSGEIFSPDYNLDEGFSHSRRYPPLYPFIIAALSFLPVELEKLGSCISIFFSLASFIPLFWLSRRLVSNAAGIAAAAVFSFQYFVLRYATPLLTEATFTFLFLCIIALGLKAFERPRIYLLALIGLLSGMAYMTRDVGISSVVMVIAAGCFYWGFMKKDRPGVLIWRAGITFGAFIIICFPYWLHIRVHTGEWNLTPQMAAEKVKGKIMTFEGTRYDRDTITDEDLVPEEAGEEGYVAEDSGVSVLPMKILRLFLDYFYQLLKKLGWLISILFFAGYLLAVIILSRKSDREGAFREVYVLLWMVQLIGLYAITSPYLVDERYIYPLVPLGIIAAAGGMVRAGGLISGFLAKRNPGLQRHGLIISALVPGLLVPAVFLSLYPEYKNLERVMDPSMIKGKFAAGHKEVAKEIKMRGLMPPGSLLLSRKPFMAYYLKGDHEVIPKTYPELLQYIENKRADYIVADSFVFYNLRPLLEPLAFGFEPDRDPEVRYTEDNQLIIRGLEISYHPPPGTRVIYSRFLPEYQRVITIYEVQPEIAGPETAGTLEDHLSAARISLSKGYYYDALEESERALEMDPGSESACQYMAYIYGQYYSIAPRAYLLTPLEKAASTWAEINPESQVARDALRFVNQARNSRSSF